MKIFFYKLVFNSQKCPNFGIIARVYRDAFKRFMFPSFKLCEIDENLRSLKRQNSDTFDCVKCVEKQNRKCLLKRVNSTFVTDWVFFVVFSFSVTYFLDSTLLFHTDTSMLPLN